MVGGYVDFALSPGGAVEFLANLPVWHHTFKDALYGTQEIIGDAVAVCPLFIDPVHP
jgi:hypothetical protein